MFLDFPKSRKEWDIAFLWREKFKRKIGLGKSYCGVKFCFPAAIFKKARKPSGLGDLGTRMPQFSFPACAQERLARFKLPFRRWLRFFAHKDLEPKKTDKDEQKEQFEDIENPSTEEI